jgi:hypothetical protein
MIDRVGRWLLLAVVVLATTAVDAMAPPTTTASAATFAYDVPPIARVDIHGFEAAGAGSAQVSVAREGSAPPAVETRRAPTTPSALRNATNPAGTPKGPSTVTQTETYAPSPMKPSAATGAWDDFLGSGQTNVNPRTGVPDPNRIFSADGTRSIRFGPHEMNSSPTKFHFHQETWTYDPVANTWHVDNVVQRVPLNK